MPVNTDDPGFGRTDLGRGLRDWAGAGPEESGYKKPKRVGSEVLVALGASVGSDLPQKAAKGGASRTWDSENEDDDYSDQDSDKEEKDDDEAKSKATSPKRQGPHRKDRKESEKEEEEEDEEEDEEKVEEEEETDEDEADRRQIRNGRVRASVRNAKQQLLASSSESEDEDEEQEGDPASGGNPGLPASPNGPGRGNAKAKAKVQAAPVKPAPGQQQGDSEPAEAAAKKNVATDAIPARGAPEQQQRDSRPAEAAARRKVATAEEEATDAIPAKAAPEQQQRDSRPAKASAKKKATTAEDQRRKRSVFASNSQQSLATETEVIDDRGRGEVRDQRGHQSQHRARGSSNKDDLADKEVDRDSEDARPRRALGRDNQDIGNSKVVGHPENETPRIKQRSEKLKEHNPRGYDPNLPSESRDDSNNNAAEGSRTGTGRTGKTIKTVGKSLQLPAAASPAGRAKDRPKTETAHVVIKNDPSWEEEYESDEEDDGGTGTGGPQGCSNQGSRSASPFFRSASPQKFGEGGPSILRETGHGLAHRSDLEPWQSPSREFPLGEESRSRSCPSPERRQRDRSRSFWIAQGLTPAEMDNVKWWNQSENTFGKAPDKSSRGVQSNQNSPHNSTGWFSLSGGSTTAGSSSARGGTRQHHNMKTAIPCTRNIVDQGPRSAHHSVEQSRPGSVSSGSRSPSSRPTSSPANRQFARVATEAENVSPLHGQRVLLAAQLGLLQGEPGINQHSPRQDMEPWWASPDLPPTSGRPLWPGDSGESPRTAGEPMAVWEDTMDHDYPRARELSQQRKQLEEKQRQLKAVQQRRQQQLQHREIQSQLRQLQRQQQDLLEQQNMRQLIWEHHQAQQTHASPRNVAQRPELRHLQEVPHGSNLQAQAPLLFPQTQQPVSPQIELPQQSELLQFPQEPIVQQHPQYEQQLLPPTQQHQQTQPLRQPQRTEYPQHLQHPQPHLFHNAAEFQSHRLQSQSPLQACEPVTSQQSQQQPRLPQQLEQQSQQQPEYLQHPQTPPQPLLVQNPEDSEPLRSQPRLQEPSQTPRRCLQRSVSPMKRAIAAPALRQPALEQRDLPRNQQQELQQQGKQQQQGQRQQQQQQQQRQQQRLLHPRHEQELPHQSPHLHPPHHPRQLFQQPQHPEMHREQRPAQHTQHLGNVQEPLQRPQYHQPQQLTTHPAHVQPAPAQLHQAMLQPRAVPQQQSLPQGQQEPQPQQPWQLQQPHQPKPQQPQQRHHTPSQPRHIKDTRQPSPTRILSQKGKTQLNQHSQHFQQSPQQLKQRPASARSQTPRMEKPASQPQQYDEQKLHKHDHLLEQRTQQRPANRQTQTDPTTILNPSQQQKNRQVVFASHQWQEQPAKLGTHSRQTQSATMNSSKRHPAPVSPPRSPSSSSRSRVRRAQARSLSPLSQHKAGAPKQRYHTPPRTKTEVRALEHQWKAYSKPPPTPKVLVENADLSDESKPAAPLKRPRVSLAPQYLLPKSRARSQARTPSPSRSPPPRERGFGGPGLAAFLPQGSGSQRSASERPRVTGNPKSTSPRNGKVQRSFVDMVTALQRGAHPGEALFNSLDTNGDGVLSPTELKRLTAGLPEDTSGRGLYGSNRLAAKALFDSLDVNRDGKVSKKELVAGLGFGTVGRGRLGPGQGAHLKASRVYMGHRNDFGQRDGYGLLKAEDGSTYTGQWANSRREGQGTLFFDGGVFEGQWHKNDANGEGIVHFQNGDKFRGTYENNVKSGAGTYCWADGTTEVGEYLDGRKHGWHRWKSASGKEVWDMLYERDTVLEARRAIDGSPAKHGDGNDGDLASSKPNGPSAVHIDSRGHQVRPPPSKARLAPGTKMDPAPLRPLPLGQRLPGAGLVRCRYCSAEPRRFAPVAIAPQGGSDG